MSESVFAQVAPALVARGYSSLPIMPGSKAPGVRSITGSWSEMPRWTRWCKERPSQYTINGWLRMIRDDDCGVGVACGQGLICIDIDLEEAVDAILAILPPSNVQKKGRKGISLFYRGNTDRIRSRNFRTPDRIGLLDLLSEGKQTVLPPSVHPDTGEPYFWMTEETLANTWPEDLTELPDDIADRLAEALKPFGYDPEGERRYEPHGTPVALSGGSGASSLFREVNDAAFDNFAAWVPALKFARYRRTRVGYEATAPWRYSGSGKPFNQRKFNLKFHPDGIKDFGTDETFTPIDVVVKKFNCTASEALDWLASRVGVQTQDPVAAALAARLIASAERKKKAR